MSICTCKMWGKGESGFTCWGGLEAHAFVILVLCECIWNAPSILLVLPTFDNTSSLGSPLHQVVYPAGSMVPPLVTASCFLVGDEEVELKLTTFSSLLLFLLLFYLSSSPDPPAI